MERILELEHKVDELLSLLEAFKELNSNIAINDVFENILLQMVQVVGAEAGTLWVVNEELQEIEVSAAYGPTSSAMLNIKLQKGEGIVGKVITTGKAHLIENVAEDPDWAKRVDQSSGFITMSMITVPLIAKGNSIGALQLLNKKKENHFTEEDVKLALALANQSALALHNSQMYDHLYKMFISVIRTLAKVLDARDPYTAGHSERVAKYSVWIAHRLGFSTGQCEELYKAALLHDIGKIGVSDEILRKPTRLTQEEYELMKQHTVIGATILSNMEPKSSVLNAIQTARSHHERIDGSGYPDRLSGDEIPLFAKIVGVADTFDAMTTVRPYSKGHTFEEGAAELVRCKNTLFDPNIVDAFTSILEECNYQLDSYEVPGFKKREIL
ncbi:putative nucleotidyltransferase with HDIG domain [Bacillus mesophilus]|uniref:HD domain-containing protein n=1 Tax=Bacillus mesophilus TaxID=1808955 RepID=A0A6M0QB99_9BACI|nr:HD domain-containing phosphohydrolase [Bacillus mesophilus]MBM7662341.1 putative nucleotidyltransferase with HDIG domain [Bacillus mesophilus]NEY73029.1 HD domain-containing protein [Bacillus mesophilus]